MIIFYLIFNGHHEAMLFKLPPKKFGMKWTKVADTNLNFLEETGSKHKAGEEVQIEARSIVIMKNEIG